MKTKRVTILIVMLSLVGILLWSAIDALVNYSDLPSALLTGSMSIIWGVIAISVYQDSKEKKV